ncbi:MAG: hypothetical protein WCJ93_06695 [Methanomicrobiales archaeon]
MVWVGAVGGLYSDSANPEFDDPVQGTLCQNCSLIAGLSALAWVNPTYIKDNISINQVRFYNWQERAQQPWGFSPTIWAPSAQFCHSPEAFELWPAYYEKAYVSCALNIHGDPTQAQYTSTLDGAASITALNRITQPQWSAFAAWGGDFYQFLSSNNLLSGESNYPPAKTAPLAGKSRQVLYPILVSTANHTYSVLGTYTNAAGTTYLILRNPKGNAVGAAPGGTLLADPWWVNYISHNAAGNATAPVWTKINLTNGVFGIKKEDFGTYFQKYSKVTI